MIEQTLLADILFLRFNRATDSIFFSEISRRVNSLRNGFVFCDRMSGLGLVCDEFYFDWLAALENQHIQRQFSLCVDYFPMRSGLHYGCFSKDK